MKRAALLLVLVLFALPAFAQLQSLSLKNNRAFVAAQADTMIPAYNMGAYNVVGLLFSAADSINGKIYADYRVIGASAWTLKDSVSIAHATTGSKYQEWVLRSAAVDVLPYVAVDWRFRFVIGGSDIGVTSPTYNITLKYR